MRTIECVEPWFSLIKYGKKTVEGRKISPKWKDICINEVIFFKRPETDDIFCSVVTDIKYYTSPNALKKYLEGETLEKTLPHDSVKTIEDGMKVYLQWSSSEEIEKYGMMAIHVNVIL